MGLSDGTCEDDAHLMALAKRLDKGGQISILEFLAAFCFEDTHGASDAFADHMVTVLFLYRHVIRAACKYFDPDFSRSVRQDEFLHVLQAWNIEIESTGLHFSDHQIEDLCESLAEAEADGTFTIPYEKFFDAFEVVDSSNVGCTVTMKHH